MTKEQYAAYLMAKFSPNSVSPLHGKLMALACLHELIIEAAEDRRWFFMEVKQLIEKV
jgi:hypothetical protein